METYTPPSLPPKYERKILKGESNASIVKELRQVVPYSGMKVKDLKILVSTVSAKLLNEKSIAEMEKDFKFYKISCLDNACPICREKAQKTYRIKERKAGYNFPPFHDDCKCMFVIEVDDWSEWTDNYVKSKTRESPQKKTGGLFGLFKK